LVFLCSILRSFKRDYQFLTNKLHMENLCPFRTVSWLFCKGISLQWSALYLLIVLSQFHIKQQQWDKYIL